MIVSDGVFISQMTVLVGALKGVGFAILMAPWICWMLSR